MRRPKPPRGSPGAEERARDWERTAYLALLVAVCAGVAAAAGSSPVLGDLLVGSFFAVMGLLLWTQRTRIRYARSVPPLTPNLAVALGLAAGVGALLVAIDLVSRGGL